MSATSSIVTISRPTAILMLLFAAFFWGAGNVANKTVLTHIDAFTAVSLRCALAALVILPFLRSETGAPRQSGWLGSATAVALFFAASLVFQQLAYRWTSVTNASFLVNICTVLTPIFAWALLNERQPKRVIVAAIVTLPGAALMSGVDPITARINPGDLACLASAMCYAGWMVALGRHASRYGRPFATCLVQFALAAILTSGIVATTQSPTFDGIWRAVPELIVLGVFSTAVAFALQTYAQRYVASSTAAVLVSAESLFGAVAAALFLGERVPAASAFGAVLILAAILLVATGPSVGADPVPQRAETLN